jgi:hypothetical protein
LWHKTHRKQNAYRSTFEPDLKQIVVRMVGIDIGNGVLHWFKTGIDRNEGFPLPAESFIGRLRDELLNETRFGSLPHSRAVLEVWRADYKSSGPHSRLGWISPATYAADRLRYATLHGRLRHADRRANEPMKRPPVPVRW